MDGGLSFPSFEGLRCLSAEFAAEVRHPSKAINQAFRNQLLPGFPGGNVIQCCGAAVMQCCSRKEARGWRQKEKCQMTTGKCQMSKVKCQKGKSK